MTRKTFNLIAKVVCLVDDKDIRQQLALNFANEPKNLNPRFDVVRFVAACVKEG